MEKLSRAQIRRLSDSELLQRRRATQAEWFVAESGSAEEADLHKMLSALDGEDIRRVEAQANWRDNLEQEQEAQWS